MAKARKALRVFCLALLLSAHLSSQGLAQKYPGDTLQAIPSPRVPSTPPPARAAPLPSAVPVPDAAAETDPDARALAARLPLDPLTANLRSRMPADVPGTMRRLGLRPPNGTRVDLRGRTPSKSEIINALVH